MGENKNFQLETLSVYGRVPCQRGVRSLPPPPQTKNPRYGPAAGIRLLSYCINLLKNARVITILLNKDEVILLEEASPCWSWLEAFNHS